MGQAHGLYLYGMQFRPDPRRRCRLRAFIFGSENQQEIQRHFLYENTAHYSLMIISNLKASKTYNNIFSVERAYYSLIIIFDFEKQ